MFVVGGYVSYKVIYAIGLTLGLWHSAPLLAGQTRLVMGDYPFDQDLAQAGQAKASANTPQRMERALGRHLEVQRQALKDAGGDIGKAMDRLLEKNQDPDAAQALFEAMREMAPQGSQVSQALAQAASAQVQSGGVRKPTAKTAAEPMYQAPSGEPGILHVARMAGKLGERMKGPKVNATDPILLEEAIRLMGIYGAPAVPEAKQVGVAGETSKIAPIHPVVKATLRALFKSGEPYLAAQACKSLGQLGDAETAEDLIKHPKNYPGASIADFGMDQMEKWKQNRLKLLKQGKGVDEASYWQSVRLTPKHMDTAIDLAMAGDAGAGMAVERNMAIEAMRSTDPDGRMARCIDTRLRFPGTREAWRADAAMGGLDALTGLLSGRSNVKTREAYLRALDHDLKLVFGQGTSWRPEDLVVLEPWCSYPVALFHYRYQHAQLWASSEFEGFFAQIETLFRKHYRNTIVFQLSGPEQGRMRTIASELSCLARHLGLPLIDYPDRKGDVRSRVDSQKRGEKDTSMMQDAQWWLPRPHSECVNAGHIQSLEDF